MGAMDITSTVRLNNGVEMPLFGLGVYLTGAGRGTENAVAWALEEGYRLIDTASMYGNEKEVGHAVRASGIPREEVFVTTKLWNDDHGFERALDAFEESRAKLGLDYVDLYLVHWPVADLRLETWRALEELLERGAVRAIGVSNYMVRHMEELLGVCRTVPAVNQVEFHPFLFQEELLGFCSEVGIRLQAYSPLARTRGFGDARVSGIAAKYGKNPAQVYLRWALQHGVSVIPKSSKRERIRENARVFDFVLEEEDMRALDSMSRDLHVSWDPSGEP
jgi:diketogulonate reductase-like aldo/keto reductase